MDIVAALSAELKLEESAASGLAGGLLLLLEDIVREKASFAEARCIRDAVPEMRDWQMSSPTLAPGMLSLDSLPPAHPLAGDQSEFLSVLGRFGLDESAAPRVASLMSRFLASRLDPAALAVVTTVAPLFNARTTA